MESILLLVFTTEETGMHSGNLPKVTKPVSESESRVHALNRLAVLLEDAS